MRRSTHLLLAALACFSLHQHAVAADPGRSIIPQLQARFGSTQSRRGSIRMPGFSSCARYACAES